MAWVDQVSFLEWMDIVLWTIPARFDPCFNSKLWLYVRLG